MNVENLLNEMITSIITLLIVTRSNTFPEEPDLSDYLIYDDAYN